MDSAWQDKMVGTQLFTLPISATLQQTNLEDLVKHLDFANVLLTSTSNLEMT